MSNVVKGAGRRKYEANKRHNQHTPLPPRTARQRTTEELAIEAAVAREEVMGRSALAGQISKAQQFALDAEKAGWEVSRTLQETADGILKTVAATRGDETLTAQWIDDKAVGPIGLYTIGAYKKQLPNAASARRFLSVPADVAVGAMKPSVKTRKVGTEAPTRRRNVRVPFSPMETSDLKVLEEVRGHLIRWSNKFTDVEENGVVPVNGSQTRIDLDDLEDLSTRQLTFCDATGGGYRTVRLSSITYVSPSSVTVSRGK